MSKQRGAFAAAMLWSSLVLAGPPATPDDRDITAINSSRIQIDFQMGPEAAPLTSVQLWYTLDAGQTWRPAALESGTRSPAVFRAEREGLHGLYLVLTNPAGASASPPRSGTTPQVWVFVDFTPPVVQLDAVDKDSRFPITRRLTLRFHVFDANLTARPLNISYRAEKADKFETIAADLPAVEQFDWQVPPAIKGRIHFRIQARDRGGQIGVADSAPIDVTDVSAPDSGRVQSNANSAFNSPANRLAPLTDESDRLHVLAVAAHPGGLSTIPLSSQLDAADAHRLRGEWAQSEARLREALARDDSRLDVRNNLALALYRQNRLREAQEEYRAVLGRDGQDRAAMGGLALVMAAQRDYRGAAQVLRSLTRIQPDDPDAWLNLGDMNVLAGDRIEGRAAWEKARQLPGASADLVERARRRLLIYSSGPLP